ncbi:hypothetical protein GGF46_000281 [Coemansia sp. RSA 552]|nr:hypothetical protein GGF46_000281 [Coemansia sp. RSA 552]
MKILGAAAMLAAVLAMAVRAVAVDVDVRVTERTGDVVFSEHLDNSAGLSSNPRVGATDALAISFTAGKEKADAAYVSFRRDGEVPREVALAAQRKGDGVYRLDVTRRVFRKYFGGAGGTYDVALVVGSFAHGGAEVKVGRIEMGGKHTSPAPRYGPRPEIHHRFAPPQRMPNVAVSLAFTALSVLALAALAQAWRRMGANVAGVRSDAAGMGLLALVAVYMALAVAYWVRLRLLTALPWALALAPPTYAVGQYALSRRSASAQKAP